MYYKPTVQRHYTWQLAGTISLALSNVVVVFFIYGTYHLLNGQTLPLLFVLCVFVSKIHQKKLSWPKFTETKSKNNRNNHGSNDCSCRWATRPERAAWDQLRDQALRNAVFAKSLVVVQIQQTTTRRVFWRFWKVVLDLRGCCRERWWAMRLTVGVI